MSLLDFYGGEIGDPQLYWGAASLMSTATPGRAGLGSAFVLPGGTFTARRNFTPSAHVFAGIGVNPAGMDGNPRIYLGLSGDAGATTHMQVILTATAVLLYRGGGLVNSYPFTTAGSVYNYYELEATVSDTVGVFTLRVNQVPVITFTGDTRNAGTNTTLDQFWIQNNGFQLNCDDFYLCNDAGSAPHNTFLGDVRVSGIRPTAAGATTGFTPDSGSNFARVNEVPYSAANYISCTAPAKDTYTMGDLVAGQSVLGVRAGAIGKNPDGGLVNLRTVVRSAGTDYVGASNVLSLNDQLVSTVYEKNPATSAAWSLAEVNALEVGVERL